MNAPDKPVSLTETDLVQLARRGDLKGIITKPPRFSATTIQAFADCERKFYWPTLAGFESPPSPAQAFGTRLHSHQEHYLKDNLLPPRTTAEGMLASIGLPMLPKPGTPGLYVEQPFEMRFDGLPAITGTRDFGVDPTELDAKGFLLGDHKTARSMNPMWRKTKAWLADNIQANLYAYTKHAELHALGFDQLTVVDKQWIYYYKDEKQVDKLRQVDSLDYVGEQFETVIRPLVVGMAAMVEAAPKVSDVALPVDRSVCDSYGGCPHRARCFGMGARGNENMGILAGRFSKQAITERVSAGSAGAGTAINPPPPKPWAKPGVVEATGLSDEMIDAAAVNITEVPEEVPVEKPKRGRPKAKPEGAEERVAQVAAQVDEAFAPRTSSARGKSLTMPGSNPAHSYWLAIGCGPEKGFDAQTVYAEEIVGAAQAAAAARLGTSHYREGQGNYGVLETCFAEWMEANALTGCVVIDPSSIVARDIIGLLRAHATLVWGRRQ